MNEIMCVTRITIGGQQYTAEELGEEKAKEIVRQRVEAAVESIGYAEMKASDKTALAIGAVGTWIYIGGVDSDLWGRAALGAGMFLLALAAKKIGDYVEACREEQKEWEEERRDAVFAAWIRNGSLKG